MAERKTKIPKTFERTDGQERPPVRCAVCNDIGWIIADAPGKSYDRSTLPCSERCPASRDVWERVINVRLKTARVPTEYSRYTFDTWVDEVSEDGKAKKWTAFVAATMYVESAPNFRLSKKAIHDELNIPMEGVERVKNGLMLYGDNGTGKTGLAVSIARALTERLYPVLYIRLQDLFAEVQGRYGAKPEGATLTPERVKQTFKTAPLLILDEFNIANVTPDKLEIAEEIIRYRYMEGLPLVSTANIGQDDFRKMWGDRIADPIRAMCHWVYVGGQNLRPLDDSFGGL